MRYRVWLPLLLVAACAPASDDLLMGGDIVAVDAGANVASVGAGEHQSLPRPTYSGPAYFPPSLGEPRVRCKYGNRELQPVLSDFERDWYSTQLAAAGEPSLYLESQAARPAGATTLRFTWLRSFHAPVVIRIETDAAGGQRLVAKELSGAGGYAPGEVSKTVDRPLTIAETKRLGTALEHTRVFDIVPDPCGGGCDGAQWIFEEVEGTRYRFASLWTPAEGPAQDLGRLLMKLTAWKFDAVY